MSASLDIVPPQLLNPSVEERRRVDRDGAARVLDGWLRRLARQESLCRRVLGRLAHAFLRRRGHHDLGFARLGDYTRERLGLSAREVQELARVAHRLERLPYTAMAFEGGMLPWSHVRLLTTVAEPATELRWLVRAACPVRDLRILVQDEAGQLRDEEEPVARFSVRCPRATRARWLEVVGLARLTSGAELTVSAAAEAIAAEGLSGATSPAEGLAPRVASAPVPRATSAPVPPPGQPDDLDWDPVDDAMPADVADLAAACEDLGPFALDARLRETQRVMQRIDWQQGRLLRLMGDRRLYRALGYSALAPYVEERLGLSARKARALVMLDRRTTALPDLAAAYREGSLSWLRALTLLPVVDERVSSAWLERAGAVTLRRLVAEVEHALETRPREGAPALPPPLDVPLRVLAERQTCAHETPGACDAVVSFSGPVSVVGLLEAAVDACRRPGEPRWRGFARLLEEVHAEWAAQPGHRDPVFARDGWRCAVPACTARRNLHDHHIVFRSRGGTNARDNRVTVCAWHHLRGLHQGRVRARGTAPDDITWQLGCRPAGAPLLVTVGDRYVAGGAG
jgi:hypothetical protein